jgi:hypothetical protein
MHGRQVSIDRQARICVSVEAFELGMMPVAASLSAKNGARQQSLAPQRDQALRVQVLGVQ